MSQDKLDNSASGNAAHLKSDSSEQNSDSSDECVATVVTDCDGTPPRKKLKRMVRYKQDWESEFPWLNTVRNNEFKGYCTVCRKEFSVGHGGKGDVVHHSEGSGHKQALKAASTRAINTFFVRSQPRSTLDQQVSYVD